MNEGETGLHALREGEPWRTGFRGVYLTSIINRYEPERSDDRPGT